MPHPHHDQPVCQDLPAPVDAWTLPSSPSSCPESSEGGERAPISSPGCREEGQSGGSKSSKCSGAATDIGRQSINESQKNFHRRRDIGREDSCFIHEDILSLDYYDVNESKKGNDHQSSIFEKLSDVMSFSVLSRRAAQSRDLDANNNDFYCVDKNMQVQRKVGLFNSRKYLSNALATKFFILLLLSLLATFALATTPAGSLPPRTSTFYLRSPPTTSALTSQRPRGAFQGSTVITRVPGATQFTSTRVPKSLRFPKPQPFQDSNDIHPNDTLTAEEFSDILRRFQLDALRATQLAEQYGLLREGARERLEEITRAESKFRGPGGDHDAPLALPLASGRPGPFRPYLKSLSDSHASPLRPGLTERRDSDPNIDRDQNMCYSGSCEFFLMCWVSGGLIEEGCGGFLYACCTRPGRAHYPGSFATPPFRDEPRGLIPIERGPVRNDPACGLTDISRIGAQRRVVGGTEAGFGSFPWQVLLTRVWSGGGCVVGVCRKDAYIRIGSSRCGGSLINKFHVVTAGHCVARARASQIRVTLGDYILNSDQEPLPARVYRASDIKVHPRFKFTPQADRYDVAVIRLEVPVHYEPHIQPICLPEKGTDFLGHFGWAAGWGALQAGSRMRPKTLQVVDVPVIDSQLCESWHRQKGINVIIHEEMMCAGYTNGGKDSCQGDSGGPLNMQIHGRWYLAGIVSAGYSCARDRQPGIYHRVAYTSDWISWAASL
ncbi:Serine proteases trypsin domain [Trinorchestia longiramus]|nr:Serine proteases trypsin domain [Trinorchestia longiramus]